MSKFDSRSSKTELMDQPNIPEKDLFLNLDELHKVNQRLGGYAISKNALKKIPQDQKNGRLVDIGCGGGDMIVVLYNHIRKMHWTLSFGGLDLNPICVKRANLVCRDRDIEVKHSDYKDLFKVFPDTGIVHACLFTHHLSNDEIVSLIKDCIKNRAVLIINDLERNPIAYYSILWITRLFSKSYLVKNDAPLSVLRGFKKREWIDLLGLAGAVNYTVENKWAFRHQVIVYG